MICRYERTIFKSDKGFCIFAYTTTDESVPNEARNRNYYGDGKIHFTAVGFHLAATNAVEVELDGNWEKSKYGLQLSVSLCKEIMPTDQNSILAYLSSGVIKGVGPEIAKAIVARFGNKTMQVLDKEPQKLLTVKGIAQSRLKRIVKSYEETKSLSDLMLYLAPYGVSMKKAAMIRDEFGDDSLKIVKTDPFQLCKIKGFSFMTVDTIARKTKVSLKHPMRYSGAINYVLDEARLSGNLFLTVDETVGQCYDLLNSDCEDEVVSENEIRQAITNERVESRIYVEGTRVYLSYERMCEVKAAKRIVSMLLQEDFDEIYDLNELIAQTEINLRQKLAQSQREAVKLCLSHPISIMTGGPGSGKTTTLRFILDIYKSVYPHNEILLAAPTGRASRRMAEQTGMEASTLHSALGLITDEENPLNDSELLSADLIVVDEFSMVDMRLAYILLERIKPGAQLIIVGDADQLPPVGAGNVLREMIRSEKVPTAVLDTVFRQASNSRIIINAHAINHNDTHLQYGDDFQLLEVQNSDEAAQLVIKNYLREVSQHGIENVQILSPFRKRGVVGSNALNEVIRDLINPPSRLKRELKCGSRVFRVGDRIMQTANRNGVSNGDVGIITGMESKDDETLVSIQLLDGRELTYTQEHMEDVEFSYCTTIHKSQGQEYPVIIVPLLKEHYIMLRRNLLYTAVTRAKAKVILIGQKQAVFIAIHKCDVGQRNTVLADRIVAYYEREIKKVHDFLETRVVKSTLVSTFIMKGQFIMNELNTCVIPAINAVEGFNPADFVRNTIGEEGETDLYLDVKYRLLWFRLHRPNGKIDSEIVRLDEKSAVVCCRIYADKADPIDQFIGKAYSQRFSTEERFGDRFLEIAETAAKGRALADAGYGTQFCMNGETLASIIADAPIKMPPDEEPEHPGNVAVTFTAQQSAECVQAASGSKPQSEVPTQPAKPVSSEPPKTLEEFLKVMTLDQAKAVKVDFGRFSGWTLGDIAMKNPGDLAWYVKNYSGHNLALKAGATKLLEAVGQMAS